MSITQPLVSPELHALIVERDEALAELSRAREGVTVAVPCFEQSQYLAQCLASVLAQTVSPFEILVVDDGSRLEEADRIRIICEQFQARYVRVTNRKLPSARNVALMQTRTLAFLPLDADDWIEPTYIEETLPLLQAGADVVVPGLQEHGPTRNGTFMPGYDRPLSEVTVELMWRDFNRTYYASLFRSELLRSVGGYNGLMVDGFEDYDLALDLMSRGARYVACEKVLFHYRTRPDGMLTTAMARQTQIRAEMARHHRW